MTKCDCNQREWGRRSWLSSTLFRLLYFLIERNNNKQHTHIIFHDNFSWPQVMGYSHFVSLIRSFEAWKEKGWSEEKGKADKLVWGMEKFVKACLIFVVLVEKEKFLQINFPFGNAAVFQVHCSCDCFLLLLLHSSSYVSLTLVYCFSLKQEAMCVTVFKD